MIRKRREPRHESQPQVGFGGPSPTGLERLCSTALRCLRCLLFKDGLHRGRTSFVSDVGTEANEGNKEFAPSHCVI